MHHYNHQSWILVTLPRANVFDKQKTFTIHTPYWLNSDHDNAEYWIHSVRTVNRKCDAFLTADFDDMSCEMIFGQDPPASNDDPALKQPCYKLCNNLFKLLFQYLYLNLLYLLEILIISLWWIVQPPIRSSNLAKNKAS